MPWLLAAGVWLVLVGGTAGYISIQRPAHSVELRHLDVATVSVQLTITATHQLGGGTDPFALEPEVAEPALKLTWHDIAGQAHSLPIQSVSAGIAEYRTLSDGLVRGRNEVLMTVATVTQPTALRLAVSHSRHSDSTPLIQEQVLWIDPADGAVSWPILIDLSETADSHEAVHETRHDAGDHP